MTRLAMLRAGYGTVGLAFVAIAATYFVPSLVLLGLGLGFVGGILLAFSDDDRPKWAGIALVVYFVLTLVAFIATTPITIKRGDENVFFAPPNLTNAVLQWIGIFSPIMLAGASVAAVWERERPARGLLLGALGGMILFGILSVLLVPSDRATGESQGALLASLLALSGAVGAVGAFWAASRADEM